MLRKLALPLLVGIGAFMVAMGLGLKFWAPDKLAIIPLDQNTRQELADPNAKFFDATSLSYKQGPLSTTLTVAADKKASQTLGGNRVILNKWQVTDNDDKAPPVDANSMTFAVDRNTGLPVSWAGTVVNPGYEAARKMSIEGYTIKFPFGLEKKTYPYWDTTLNKPMNMKYVSTESINGLEVFKFEGTVPDTTFRQQEVPGSIFGLGASSPGQLADRSYANTRTIWAEPQTGVFIKVSEHQVQQFRIAGHDPAPAVDTTQVFTDATVKENTDYWGQKAFLLKVLKIVPWVLIPLGILTILAAPLVSRLLDRGDGERDGGDDQWDDWDDDDQSGRDDGADWSDGAGENGAVEAYGSRAERRGSVDGDDTIEVHKS